MKIKLTFAILSLMLVVGCSSTGKADNQSDDYVRSMYPGWAVQGKSVMPFDSNDDGYVSVDVRIKNTKTDEERTLYLECAKAFKMNQGCKERNTTLKR
jgi:hypothetical protein